MFDLDELPQQIAPRIVDRFESESKRLLDAARPLWPVRTGKSKAGLHYRTSLATDAIQTRIYNRESYAYKIRFSRFTADELAARAKTVKQARWMLDKFGAGAPSTRLIMKPVWSQLVAIPFRKTIDPVADDLADDLHRLADGEG
ncbi:hypothetical protein HN937_30515 [Candidatus Poribacteria bacterium]|nr:hypothetical protein [Candidatus Poribacteria bacterium]